MPYGYRKTDAGLISLDRADCDRDDYGDRYARHIDLGFFGQLSVSLIYGCFSCVCNLLGGAIIFIKISY